MPERVVKAKSLGAGEIQAELLILDDRAARRLAEEMGVAVIGVVGVLLAAKASGLLEEVVPVIDQLIENEFRVSQALRDEIARQEEIR